MNHDDLLAYYQQELTLLRQLGAEFSQAHPKIAGRLRLGAKMVEDPHVARLLEAFAFLTAHVHAKLDDDFPAISDALLEVLYPNYLAPLPALSIAHLQIDIEKLTGLKTIAKNTLLVSDSSYGESCFFRTCYPVELWPIKVIDANVNSSPAVLRLRLGCTKDKLVFAGFELDKLRFFIHAAPQQAYALYQLLFNHVRAITLAESTQDKNPISLDKSCLRQVGFDEDNNLLPYNSRIFMGHRLLTEFFALPEKFLFFELVDLKDKIKNKFIKENQNLEIYLYLGKIDTGRKKHKCR